MTQAAKFLAVHRRPDGKREYRMCTTQAEAKKFAKHGKKTGR